MRGSFKILCVVLVILLVSNWSLSTLKIQSDKISCQNNLQFPRVFSVNHNYVGQAHKRFENQICNNVRASCCSELQFNDLAHYWDKQNAENSFSREQRQYAYWLYSIAVTYYEQAQIEATELKKFADKLTPDIKDAIDKIHDKTFWDNHNKKLFSEDAEKCWEFNSKLLKGIMCGMCSAETYLRIRENYAYFDKKEAAEFSKSCGGYFHQLRNLSEWMNAVAKVVRLDHNGNPQNNREALNFMFYWETDAEYQHENITKNTENCKKSSMEISFDAVKPDSNCELVVTKYMGIGPLTKFDQKIRISVQTLFNWLRNDYKNSVRSSVRNQMLNPEEIIEETQETTDEKNRVLAASSTWEPKDGISQQFWKGLKQFRSRLQKDDIFEMPLYIMGDSSSSLRGFDVQDYYIFKSQETKCYLAKYYGATTGQIVNLRGSDNRSVCKPTTNSCCEENYYSGLVKKWDEETTVIKKFMEIMHKLAEQFSNMQNKTDENGKNILKDKIHDLNKNVECGEHCHYISAGVNVLQVVNKHKKRINAVNIGSTQCVNYLLEKSRNLKCAACDINQHDIFYTDPKTQNKFVKISSNGCSDLFKKCYQPYQDAVQLWNVFIVDLNYLAKKYTQMDTKKAPELNVNLEQVYQSTNCSKIWNNYDDKTKVKIGISTQCIDVCENFMNHVIASNPIDFKIEYFDAIKQIYEAFSPSDVEGLEELKAEAQKVLELLDNLNQKDEKTGKNIELTKSVFWEDADDKFNVFDKKQSGLELKNMAFAKFGAYSNLVIISLNQLLFTLFQQ